jgi:tetratricopeptide (TPR) repeat protein
LLLTAPVALSAAVLDSESNETELEAALELLDGGRRFEGLEKLQALIRHYPEFANAYFYLGLFYTNIEQYDIAVGYLEQALKLDDEVGAYHNQLGIVLAADYKYREAAIQFRLALERVGKPQRAEVWENLAEMHVRLAEHDQAISALEQALDLDPHASNARAKLGRLLLEQNRIDEALVQLAEAAEGSTSSDVYLSLGVAHIRKGDPELALPSLQRAASLSPSSTRAAYALAQALRQLGENEAATLELRRYHTLQQQSEADETMARRLTSAISTASELLEKRNYADAETILRQTLATHPDHPVILHVLGFAQLRQDQAAAAVETLRHSAEQEPLNADTHFYLGYAYFLDNELEAAQAATERAILIYEWEPRYHVQLAYIQIEREFFEAATQSLHRALTLDPRSFAARLALGSLDLRADRLGDAEAHLRATIALNETSADAHRLLGLALWRQRRFPEAIEQYEAHVRLAPQDEYAHRLLIDALVDLDESAYAEAAIRRWQAAIPGSRPAAYNLGDLLYRKGKHHDAVDTMLAALSLEGDEPPEGAIYARLGQIYSGLNRIDEAVAAYRRAQSLSPKSVASHGALGNLYLLRNQNDQALEQFSTVLELDPDNAHGHERLAQTNLRLGRHQLAVDHAQAALRLDGDMNEARYTLAQALRRLGRNEEAREIIEEFRQHEATAQLRQHRERERAALVQEAMSEIEQGSYDPAVRLLQDAVRFDPQKGFPYVRLGLAQSLAGRHDEAVRSLQKALEIEPDAAQLYQLLSDEYRYLGNINESDRLREAYLRGLEQKAGASRANDEPASSAASSEIEQ